MSREAKKRRNLSTFLSFSRPEELELERVEGLLLVLLLVLLLRKAMVVVRRRKRLLLLLLGRPRRRRSRTIAAWIAVVNSPPMPTATT